MIADSWVVVELRLVSPLKKNVETAAKRSIYKLLTGKQNYTNQGSL